MQRRKFSECLNKEAKIYNQPLIAVIGCGVCLSLGFLFYDFLGAVAGCGIGYFGGVVFSNGWHSGKIQSFLYWHIPGARLFISKKIPESHKRELH